MQRVSRGLFAGSVLGKYGLTLTSVPRSLYLPPVRSVVTCSHEQARRQDDAVLVLPPRILNDTKPLKRNR